MEPRTLRMIGNVGLAFGVAGSAYTLVIVGLGMTGAIESPSAFTIVLIGIQSVVNVAVGWNLRRGTDTSAR